jgi:hypothetical protein
MQIKWRRFMKRVPTEFIQVFALNDLPCQACLKANDYGFSVYRGVLIQWGHESGEYMHAKLATEFVDSLYDARDRVLVLHIHEATKELRLLIGGEGPMDSKLVEGTEFRGFMIMHVNKI